jgi:hypothetical protein
LSEHEKCHGTSPTNEDFLCDKAAVFRDRIKLPCSGTGQNFYVQGHDKSVAFRERIKLLYSGTYKFAKLLYSGTG